MRILVLTNMYPTPNEPGFGSFVRDQVQDLRTLGADVEVLAFDGRRDRRAYGRAAVRVRRVARRGRFDVLHAHYGLTGAVALAQRSLPVATTFHGSECGYEGSPGWHARTSWVVARRTTPVFVSRDLARRLGLPDATVVACGGDTELFAPRDRNEARRILGWNENAPYVLFPGSRMNQRKRPDLFDAAVRTARRDLPALTPVSLENVSRERVALIVNAVDATLMTSDFEGAPVAIKESLACQTPVVSVSVGDVPELLSGLPGCEVAARHPEALAAALLRALSAGRNEALRRRAKEYSRPRAAERLLEVLAEAAS